MHELNLQERDKKALRALGVRWEAKPKASLSTSKGIARFSAAGALLVKAKKTAGRVALITGNTIERHRTPFMALVCAAAVHPALTPSKSLAAGLLFSIVSTPVWDTIRAHTGRPKYWNKGSLLEGRLLNIGASTQLDSFGNPYRTGPHWGYIALFALACVASNPDKQLQARQSYLAAKDQILNRTAPTIRCYIGPALVSSLSNEPFSDPYVTSDILASAATCANRSQGASSPKAAIDDLDPTFVGGYARSTSGLISALTNGMHQGPMPVI